MRNKTWRKAFIVIAVLAVALAVVPAASADDSDLTLDRPYPFQAGEAQLYDSGPTNDGLIPMTVIIDGAGTAGTTGQPDVLCKWELPDMLETVPGAPPVNTGVQYNDGVVDLLGDLVNPSDDAEENPAFPCALDAGVIAQRDGVANMMQVRAWEGDGTDKNAVHVIGPGDGERIIEVHALTNNEPTSVYWRVFHPDGSIKVQLHQNQWVCGPEVGYNQFTGALTPDTMLWAANKTAQVNANIVGQAEVDDGNINHGCIQNEYRFWSQSFTLSKHQPCGEYLVEVTANNAGGQDVLTNSFDVICFQSIDVDFTSIDWGTLEFGGNDDIGGDFDFVLDDGAPSVRNLGSGGMEVGIDFYRMKRLCLNGAGLSVDDGTGDFAGVAGCDADGDFHDGAKAIEKFDAKLGIDIFDLEYPLDGGVRQATVNAVDARLLTPDPTLWFGTDDNQTVCTDEVAKLHLSIHPGDEEVVAGTYQGAVKLYGRPDMGKSAGVTAPNSNRVDTTATVNLTTGVADLPRNDAGIGNDDILADGTWDGPALTYTCANDNGIWGGYHDDGANNAKDGGGYGDVPLQTSDDKYYDNDNNGRSDLSKEAGQSNQRSIWNQ